MGSASGTGLKKADFEGKTKAIRSHWLRWTILIAAVAVVTGTLAVFVFYWPFGSNRGAAAARKLPRQSLDTEISPSSFSASGLRSQTANLNARRCRKPGKWQRFRK